MNLTYDIRAETLLAKLKGNTEQLRGAMVSVVNRLAIQVQTSVKEDKLTGQALSVRSNNLRGSINIKDPDASGDIVASVGTNLVYGRIHEFGYQGPMTIKAHTRESVLGNSYGVRAHVRQVNLPARSFLRSTLREMTPHIQESLRAAAIKAVQV